MLDKTIYRIIKDNMKGRNNMKNKMTKYIVTSNETVYVTYKQEQIAKNEEQAKKLADERGNWGEPIEEQNGGDREIEVSESKGANL